MPAGNGECVLLVEDEGMVRQLMRRLLEQRGYRVLEASGASAALQLAAREGAALDLLLTDVVLRDSSGPEIAGRIRQQLPGVAVLYVSGYAQDGSVMQARLAAGDHFLAKPFSSEAFGRAVGEALARPARH